MQIERLETMATRNKRHLVIDIVVTAALLIGIGSAAVIGAFYLPKLAPALSDSAALLVINERAAAFAPQ